MAKKKYYAVAVGRNTGVFKSWDECKAQVNGFSGSKYKSFQTEKEAQDFVARSGNVVVATSAIQPSLPAKRPRDETSDTGPHDLPSLPISSSRKKQKTGNVTKIHIMFDGGARNNPGVAGAGALVSIANRRTLHVRHFVGAMSTNNVAEYFGFLSGLQAALKECDNVNEIDEFVVEGDSQLVIRQIKGEYKVSSDNLKDVFRQAQALIEKVESEFKCKIKLRHVLRRANKAADRLANEAMDERQSWITTSDDNHLSWQTLDAFFSGEQEGEGQEVINV